MCVSHAAGTLTAHHANTLTNTTPDRPCTYTPTPTCAPPFFLYISDGFLPQTQVPAPVLAEHVTGPRVAAAREVLIGPLIAHAPTPMPMPTQPSVDSAPGYEQSPGRAIRGLHARSPRAVCTAAEFENATGLCQTCTLCQGPAATAINCSATEDAFCTQVPQMQLMSATVRQLIAGMSCEIHYTAAYQLDYWDVV